ncbi:MAG: hypothetical protein ABII06_12900 [Pseudomonadota bacterium]
MRKNHVIGGLIVFCVGLFLLYFYSPYVVEVLKGALQPALILIGLVAMAGAVLGKKEFKKMNLLAAVLFLLLGLYGFYDEYYAVIDFFYGMMPPLLVVAGLVAIFQGIKKLT